VRAVAAVATSPAPPSAAQRRAACRSHGGRGRRIAAQEQARSTHPPALTPPAQRRLACQRARRLLNQQVQHIRLPASSLRHDTGAWYSGEARCAAAPPKQADAACMLRALAQAAAAAPSPAARLTHWVGAQVLRRGWATASLAPRA